MIFINTVQKYCMKYSYEYMYLYIGILHYRYSRVHQKIKKSLENILTMIFNEFDMYKMGIHNRNT